MARHSNQYPEAPAAVFVCECMCIQRGAARNSTQNARATQIPFTLVGGIHRTAISLHHI